MVFKFFFRTARNLPRVAAAGTLGAVGWSRFLVDHDVPKAPSINAQVSAVGDARAGTVTLFSDRSGEGRPVLLIHSVNAAASAHEMAPIFDRLRGERPVWAMDLPGFGDSERGDRAYTPELMADAVIAALEAIGEPAEVVAMSLASEFAARAADERPELFASLALLSPTGFGPVRSSGRGAGRILRFPLWSQALFDLIATRRSIEFFLSKSLTGPVDHVMVEAAYRTAHQPGARYAPLSFLSGELFSADAVSLLYEKSTVPTLVLYDTDPFTSFVRLAEVVADRGDVWNPVRIPGTRGLPHWDEPIETLDRLRQHWDRVHAG